MGKKDKHLSIDMGFLGNEKSPSHATKQVHSNEPVSTPKTTSTGYKYNWRNILIVGGVILFIGFMILANSDDSSSTVNNSTPTATAPTTPTSGTTHGDDENYTLGEYSCSQYHYGQAVALDPDDNENQLKNETSTLESRANKIERMEREINNTYVNEYSDQWEINEYNDLVDEYNRELNSYNRDVATLDIRIDKFNNQIEKHNNYLTSNCTKRY